MNAKLRIKLLPILVFRKKSLHLPIESPILSCSAPHSLFLSAEQRQNSQLLRSHSLEKKIWNGYTQCFQPWTYFLGLWKCCFIRLKRLFHTPETTVSYAWNNCFIRLKHLRCRILQRKSPVNKRRVFSENAMYRTLLVWPSALRTFFTHLLFI